MAEQIGIFDEQFGKLERAMQVAAQRQAIIAHNIANANTPGYCAMEFDEHLMRAVERISNKNVNLEDELSALSKNSVDYSSYAKLISSRLSNLRTIVTQGRR